MRKRYMSTLIYPDPQLRILFWNKRTYSKDLFKDRFMLFFVHSWERIDISLLLQKPTQKRFEAPWEDNWNHLGSHQLMFQYCEEKNAGLYMQKNPRIIKIKNFKDLWRKCSATSCSKKPNIISEKLDLTSYSHRTLPRQVLKMSWGGDSTAYYTAWPSTVSRLFFLYVHCCSTVSCPFITDLGEDSNFILSIIVH